VTGAKLRPQSPKVKRSNVAQSFQTAVSRAFNPQTVQASQRRWELANSLPIENQRYGRLENLRHEAAQGKIVLNRLVRESYEPGGNSAGLPWPFRR